MKKLVTLLLAAGMVLGSFAGAQAIDWKVKGNWQFEFNMTDGLSFVRQASRTNRATRYGNGVGRDNFEALQRINLVLQAVASENLSGTLHLEIGHTVWGQANSLGTRNWGGAMGQRGVNIGVREAYIDWFVPTTDLKLRMGIQRLDTPSYTFGPMVFGQDVAGVTASYKVNDNISVTAFWARPFNDNFGSVTGADNNFGNGNGIGNGLGQSRAMDNVDVFGLLLPLSFDGFKVTPWGMIGAVGPNWARNAPGNGNRFGAVGQGMTPSFYDTHNRRAVRNLNADGDPLTAPVARGSSQYATAWWAGLTGEITAMDPFRLAWDATYGEITYADTGFLNRHGWIINLLAEYKLDWGIPGIYGWWGSGDDSNPRNGSERLPVFDITDPNNMMSTFGFNGSYSQGGSDGIDGIYAQSSFTGTWGIGARIRDMSFLEDLKHTVRVNFFGGTNAPAMAKYMLGKKTVGGTRSGTVDFYNAIGGLGPYMTTQDYGVEVNFDSLYKIYENLDMIVELGYIHLWMDQSRAVWGSGTQAAALGGGGIRGVSVTDAVKASLMFRYSF